MKKYILFLFIFVFGLGLFSFNIKPVIASTDCAISSTLRVGSTGDEVACLQTRLGISADGKFGPMTKASVVNWQAGHGLGADGVFGARSRAAFVANGSVSGNFPAGCESASGYSRTTGLPCVALPSISPDYPRDDCEFNNDGYSKITGLPCRPRPQAPIITTLSPSTGSVLTQVTINGSRFTPTGNIIHFGGETQWNLNSPDSRTLVFNVPTFSAVDGTPIQTGAYAVSVNNSLGTSNAVYFIVTSAPTTQSPTITSIYPDGCSSSNTGYSSTTGLPCSSANIGDTVSVYGTNFGANIFVAGYSSVDGSYYTAQTTFVSSSSLRFIVPSNAGSGVHSVVLHDGSSVSNGVNLNFVGTTSNAPTITTNSLPNGTVGSSYSATVSATGGTGSYDWKISSGFLPPGLSLITAQCFAYPCQVPATISGTPTAAGTSPSTFTITLTTGPGVSVSKTFSINISNTNSVPNVTISANPMTVNSGGSSTVAWSSTNTTSCTGTGGDNLGWSGTTKPTSGTYQTVPLYNVATPYGITCYGVSGTTPATASVTITVIPTSTGGNLPDGCTSHNGYSSTTGMSCS